MKIAIIGAGNMGGAVARGLAKGSLVKTSDITVSNPSRGKLEALKVEFPELNITCENSRAATGADVVILAETLEDTSDRGKSKVVWIMTIRR